MFKSELKNKVKELESKVKELKNKVIYMEERFKKLDWDKSVETLNSSALKLIDKYKDNKLFIEIKANYVPFESYKYTNQNSYVILYYGLGEPIYDNAQRNMYKVTSDAMSFINNELEDIIKVKLYDEMKNKKGVKSNVKTKNRCNK